MFGIPFYYFLIIQHKHEAAKCQHFKVFLSFTSIINLLHKYPLHLLNCSAIGPFDIYLTGGCLLFQVMCAGVCYRSKRSISVNSAASLGSIGSDHSSCSNKGVRDTSLFPGRWYTLTGILLQTCGRCRKEQRYNGN